MRQIESNALVLVLEKKEPFFPSKRRILVNGISMYKAQTTVKFAN